MVHSPDLDPYRTQTQAPAGQRLRMAWTFIVLGLAFAVLAACIVVLWA